MLLACQDFLNQKGINWDHRLFLAGYSEGGYATLATQQLIEMAYQKLPLQGSSCGAGPYAARSFFRYITQQSTIGYLANYLYIWQTLTYNRIYHLNKPIHTNSRLT